jgi:ferredoxin
MTADVSVGTRAPPRPQLCFYHASRAKNVESIRLVVRTGCACPTCAGRVRQGKSAVSQKRTAESNSVDTSRRASEDTRHAHAADEHAITT